jgi:hypothetical protein
MPPASQIKRAMATTPRESHGGFELRMDDFAIPQ